MKNTKLRWNIILWMGFVHLAALVALPYVSATNLVALLVMYPVTAIGVTLGYHRMMSHKAFKAPKWLERTLMTIASLSVQGGPMEWVGLHRHHHLHSDQPLDHHNSRKGLWWSHMGWMFQEVPAMKEVPNLTKDMQKDPYYVWLENNFMVPTLIFGALCYWLGGWSLLGWAVFVRLVVVYHVTWLVNSATHTWGYRRYDTPDNSRMNWWVALLAFGEGWHNSHHHNQANAFHGEKWWEVDVTGYIIRLLYSMNLITNVKA